MGAGGRVTGESSGLGSASCSVDWGASLPAVPVTRPCSCSWVTALLRCSVAMDSAARLTPDVSAISASTVKYTTR